MTVASTTRRADAVGNGAASVYPFAYRILDDDDLLVSVENTNGSITTLAKTTDYTVTGVGAYSGGSITLVNNGQAWLDADGDLLTNYRITIRRRLAITQTTDLRNRGGFYPEDHETAFDRLTMICLQQQDEIDRSIKFAETDATSLTTSLPAASVRASTYLFFDASGNVGVSSGLASVPVSSYMATVVDDTTAEAALTTLGATKIVSTLTALKALASPNLAGTAYLLGRVSAGDGGHGLFRWVTGDQSANVTADPQTIEWVPPDSAATGASGAWRRIYGGVIDLRAAGVVADSNGTTGNGTDNTVALQRLGTWLSGKKNVQVIGPSGIVRFVAPTSGTIFDLSSSEGITFWLPGTEFFDDRTYVDASNETATLLKATACLNLAWVSKKITTDQVSFSNFAGLTGMLLLQGCRNCSFDTEMVGGDSGVRATRAYTDSESYRSRGIIVNLKCTSTHYPYNAQHSGDDATVFVNADSCGRNFFIYGVKNQRITIRSKSQQANSLIKAYSGYGVEDCRIVYTDTETTAGVAAAYVLEFSFGDSTAAVIRNIDVALNIKNPSANPWGHAIAFSKYSDGGSTVDTTGRGHKLENIKISGVSDYSSVAAGSDHASWIAGAFASSDVQRNVVFENFVGLGTNANIGNLSLLTLDGRCVWRSVKIEGNIETGVNPSGSEVVFVGCQAKNFTTATNVAALHTYIGCRITDGTLQATASKTFIDTEFHGARRSTNFAGTGLYVVRAVKLRTGDQTGSTNIFKIVPAPATGLQFRLKYYLVGDDGDTNAATRNETVGIKSWSAFLTGTGVWAVQLAVGNEVTERTQGSPSVLTVSLVNGDATGAHIAVAATVYNGANAKGIYVLEVLSSDPRVGATVV